MYTKLIAFIKRGLTSYQIKIIALISMTIDHIGGNLHHIPSLIGFRYPLQKIGHIAAPLFLYMIVESAKHTKNRRKFLLRLYLAGVSVGLFTAILNAVFAYFFDTAKGMDNIILAYFFVVLHIYLIEWFISAIKEKNFRDIFLSVVLFGLSFVPVLFYFFGYQEILNIISVSNPDTFRGQGVPSKNRYRPYCQGIVNPLAAALLTFLFDLHAHFVPRWDEVRIIMLKVSVRYFL